MMPTPLLKSLAAKTKTPLPEVERLWAKAKATAEEQGYPENYPYIVGVMKSMLGITESIDYTDECEFYIDEMLNEGLSAASRIMKSIKSRNTATRTSDRRNALRDRQKSISQLSSLALRKARMAMKMKLAGVNTYRKYYAIDPARKSSIEKTVKQQRGQVKALASTFLQGLIAKYKAMLPDAIASKYSYKDHFELVQYKNGKGALLYKKGDEPLLDDIPTLKYGALIADMLIRKVGKDLETIEFKPLRKLAHEADKVVKKTITQDQEQNGANSPTTT